MKVVSGEENIKSVTGISKTMGTVNLKLKIGNIEKNVSIFVIKSESFNEDMLLGLDVIKDFELCQDEKLKITQKKISDYVWMKNQISLKV